MVAHEQSECIRGGASAIKTSIYGLGQATVRCCKAVDDFHQSVARELQALDSIRVLPWKVGAKLCKCFQGFVDFPLHECFARQLS